MLTQGISGAEVDRLIDIPLELVWQVDDLVSHESRAHIAKTFSDPSHWLAVRETIVTQGKQSLNGGQRINLGKHEIITGVSVHVASRQRKPN